MATLWQHAPWSCNKRIRGHSGFIVPGFIVRGIRRDRPH
jgi:hypothetical protein